MARYITKNEVVDCIHQNKHINVVVMPPMSYPFHDDPDEFTRFRLRSVGIWTIVRYSQKNYILAVQQADQPGNPWGIPAGHTEEKDLTPVDTANRELLEEIGVTASKLIFLRHILSTTPNQGHLIFATSINKSQLSITGEEAPDKNGIIYAEPPSNVDRTEIKRISLIPTNLAVTFLNPLLNNPYHSEAVNPGIESLTGYGLLPSTRKLRSDPYLFD